MARSIRISFLSVLILSIAGLFTAALLSHLHYTLPSGTSSTFQLCRKGCDTVNTSSYSELYGVPIASYGAVAYSELLIASLLGLLLATTPLALYLLSVVFGISLFCLAVSLILAAISIFRLSSFCNLCGFTYLINFLLVLASGTALKTTSRYISGTSSEARHSAAPSVSKTVGMEGYYRKCLKGVILFTLFLNALSGWAISYFHSGKYRILDKEKSQKFFESYATLPRMTIQIEGSPSKGSQNPKLTIVEFSDFNCGFCRNASFVLSRLLPEYRKDLRIVYKHMPHDKTCNPYENFVSHRRSCELSAASLCAQRYGKFWEYHDLLFEPSHVDASKDLIPFARKIGIDEHGFKMCMMDSETQQTLLKDIEEAHRLGVKSTPTFFLNGKMLQGLPPTSLLHELIQRELRERSGR